MSLLHLALNNRFWYSTISKGLLQKTSTFGTCRCVASWEKDVCRVNHNVLLPLLSNSTCLSVTTASIILSFYNINLNTTYKKKLWVNLLINNLLVSGWHNIDQALNLTCVCFSSNGCFPHHKEVRYSSSKLFAYSSNAAGALVAAMCVHMCTWTHRPICAIAGKPSCPSFSIWPGSPAFPSSRVNIPSKITIEGRISLWKKLKPLQLLVRDWNESWWERLKWV